MVFGPGPPEAKGDGPWLVLPYLLWGNKLFLDAVRRLVMG